MVGVLSLYQTSIGKKAVMAVTGFILYGFVFAHMYGNLKMFVGPVAMNAYAEHLRTIGEPILAYEMALWLIRIVLLTSLVGHVGSAIALTRQDWASRPRGYAAGRRNVQASYAALTLRWGGAILFFFLVYHLLHFTVGAVHPEFMPGNPYNNVIVGFQSPVVVVAYLVAVGALGMHLYHGVWSLFQTLGLNNYRTDRWWRALAVISGLLLFVGFAAVPLAVQAGVLHL